VILDNDENLDEAKGPSGEVDSRRSELDASLHNTFLTLKTRLSADRVY
jgi:hypothetical protein